MPEIRNGGGPRETDKVTAIHIKHVERIRLPRSIPHGRKRPWISNAKMVITAETAHGHFVPVRDIRDLDRLPRETKIRIARAVFSELIGQTIDIELGIENTPDGPYQRFVGRINEEHFLADITWPHIRERYQELTKVGGTD